MPSPFVTVTPNPAWDVTYEVPALTPGEVHRVTRVHRRLGGKGVNAARVLVALGHEAVAVIPGPDGLEPDRALEVDVVPGLAVIRQALVVQAADGTTTSLWEPGTEPAPDLASRLLTRVRGWLRPSGTSSSPAASPAAPRAAGLVVAGSLPPGLDPKLPARLAALALDHEVPVIVDTSGPALARAAEVPGVVLAPNAAELAELTGTGCGDPAVLSTVPPTVSPTAAITAAIAAARRVLDAGPGRGPRAIVVTLGERGLAAVTRDGTWHGRLPEPLSGNTTGAGDAAVAALIAGLAWPPAPWPDLVRDAVAASAAAVLSPVAGEVSRADYQRLHTLVRVREVRDSEVT